MKKSIVALLAISVLSVSALAGVTGTIVDTKVEADGTIKVTIGNTKKNLLGTADAKKAMYAGVLTALNSGKTVVGGTGSYEGTSGWISMKILP
jgi:hypothetical protein